MTPDRAERSHRIREQQREKIIAAALQLFAKKGLHNTKVSEVATQAGVSHGNIYWYFDSKEKLFEAAFLKEFDALITPFSEIAADEKQPAREKLMDIATESIDLFARANSDVIFVMFQAMATPDVGSLITPHFQEYYQEMNSTCAQLFKQAGDPNPAATSAMYMAMLDGLMLYRLLFPQMIDRDQVLAQIKNKFNL